MPEKFVLPDHLRVTTAQPRDGDIIDPNIEGNDCNVRGRPTDYDPRYMPKVAFSMTLLGATLPELAHALGVCPATISNWKNEHPEFLEACKQGGRVADARVAQSLFKRAVGFKHPAVKVFQDANGDPVFVPYEVYVPPDVGACKFWLRVRCGWGEPKDPSIPVGVRPSEHADLINRIRERLKRLIGEYDAAASPDGRAGTDY
jgi:hypothetical protein